MTAHGPFGVSGERHPPELDAVRGSDDFLAALRLAKRRAGNPSFAVMRRRCGVPASTLADAVRQGRSTVPRWEVVRGFLQACGAGAAEVALWQSAWQRVTGGDDLPGTATADDAGTPRQLPPDVPHLLGRDAQLHGMDALHRADHGGPLLLVGGAGVGKTALAVHWAHRVTGRYPDGHLFLDLGGTAAHRALEPAAALRLLLAGLGVSEPEMPGSLDAMVGRYRSLTYGRRLLVVLDDARDAGQVRPLLPGGPACTTVVTSRFRLSALVACDGAARVGVPALTADESVRLLTVLVADGRTDAEPAAARHLACLCGHLPLAVRIAATYLADRPHWAVADYAQMLQGEDRLSYLSFPGEEDAGLPAAFGRSYDGLPPAAKRIFRGLAATPLPDFGVDDAAMAAGLPRAEAWRQLDTLIGAHLVEPVARGRYAVTELLRLYAASLTGLPVPLPARRRTVRWPRRRRPRAADTAWRAAAAA